MSRFDDLRRNLDKTMRGIELGPYYSPIAPKKYGWNTTVVDFRDAAALRAEARNHKADGIRMRESLIEEVDIVWRGEPLDTLALARNPDGYDYFIASHTIENSPDLLSLFQQVQRLLRPGGIVSLAVPDMRKCFDVFKPASSLREVLTAYREKRIRHTPETLLEARAFSVIRNGSGAWLAGSRGPLKFHRSFDDCWQEYQRDVNQVDPPYVDAHAWFFTPASFELLIFELGYMDLLDLSIDSLRENQGSEFVVQLRAGQPAKPGPNEFDAKRLELSLRQVSEFAAEVLGDTGSNLPPGPPPPEPKPVVVQVPVYVEVPIHVQPPVQSTAEVARLLASRVRRKALSLVGLA